MALPFFKFKPETPTETALMCVRDELPELAHNLVRFELPELHAADVLNVHTQEPDQLAKAIPGDALDIMTSDSHVEGRIYQLGESPVFIAQRVIGPALPDLDNTTVESRAKDVARSIAADRRGEWFEHVYPFGEQPIPAAINNHLKELTTYARDFDAYFVIAVIDTAFVVMPATRDKKVWQNGPSQRYAQYANLRDAQGELAAQAMVYIDPGEKSSYTNSEQIGVMDADIPYGQLQYDVDTAGIVVDTTVEEHRRGTVLKVFKAAGSHALGSSDFGYEVTLDGPAEECIVVGITDAKTNGWDVPAR